MGFEKTATDEAAPVSPQTRAEDFPEKHTNVAANGTDSSLSSDNENQAGVARVEATTTVWTKWDMIAAYACIWLIYFITSTQEVVVRGLSPFVTSAFQQHSLTAATNIMSSIIAGLAKLPLAKILDTWGRPQGLAIMTVVWTLGFVMMAACENVETYAAAQVFSSVGAQGVSYSLTVFISDTSSLLNRSLMLAFATSPYIVTPWIGGPINSSILAANGIGFRWGLGIWAIVTPVVLLPLIILFLLNDRKAQKQGLISPSGPTLSLAAIKKYLIDVDLLGILILAAGMALFLLPFSLWSFQAEGWRAPLIISMIIVGGLLIIAFVLYEKFLAPVSFIPYHLLMDRTVFFGGMMFVFVFFNSAVWGSFFYSMLIVVWDVGVEKATYISNIYRVGSCFASLPIGYLVRVTGRFKWVAMYYALPLMMLGVGLMIQFRQPDAEIGYVVMTQIFVAFAGGPIVIAGEMAMLAPSDHQHIAVIIAVLDLFGSIGSALGSTVATAIWTGTFKKALANRLPSITPKMVDDIYKSIDTQSSYPVGSEMRRGISLAYGDSQRIMLITSLALLAGAAGCVAMWRDIKLKDKKQVKGNVV